MQKNGWLQIAANSFSSLNNAWREGVEIMSFFQKNSLFLIFNARRKKKASGGNHELKFSTLDLPPEVLLLHIELKIKMGRKFFKKGMISIPW